MIKDRIHRSLASPRPHLISRRHFPWRGPLPPRSLAPYRLHKAAQPQQHAACPGLQAHEDPLAEPGLELLRKLQPEPVAEDSFRGVRHGKTVDLVRKRVLGGAVRIEAGQVG